MWGLGDGSSMEETGTPLVPPRWGQTGQGQASSFCNKLNSLKADPSLFPTKIPPDRSRGLRDGVRISEMYG